MTENKEGGKVNSTPGQNQVLPKYSERRDLSVTTNTLFPTRENIKDDDIARIITRDEMAWVILERRADDVFNKWFTIQADNKLKLAIEELNKRLKVKKAFKLWYKMKKAFGYALLFLGYNDTKENILEEPTSTRELTYIIPFPKKVVDSYKKFTDITSEKWGQIETYTISVIVDDKEELMTIPASRFIHWRNEGIDNDEEGTSMFLPMYNSFLLKYNMDYAVFEALWKSASGLWVLKYPEGVTPTDDDAAADGFNNMDVKTEMRLPFGFDTDIKDTNKGMNPAAHIKYMLNKIGTGSRMGKTSLTGTEAGQVAGAEWNFKQYYAFISDEQTEDVQPILEEFYNLMMVGGILPTGEYKIIWNSPFERSPDEIAEINNKNADFANKVADALVKIDTTDHQIAIEEDGRTFIRVHNSDKGILLEGITAELLESPQFTISTPAPATASLNYTNIDKEERLNIYREWEPSIDKDTPTFTADLQKAISDYEQAWLKRFEVIWEQSGFSLNFMAKTNKYDATRNDVKDLVNNLQKVAPSDKTIQTVLYKYLNISYETGWEDTVVALDLTYDLPIDQPLVDEWLASQAPMLKEDITNDINNRLLRGIRDGIAAGEGYPGINKRLEGIIADYNKGIPNTVHKYVALAQQTARADQLEKEGDKQVLWLSVGDDRVRPKHTDLEVASPHNIEDVRQFFGEWGCRCTITPYTVLEKYRREGEI